MSHLSLVPNLPPPTHIVAPDAWLIEPDGTYKWTQQRLGVAWAQAQTQFLSILKDPRGVTQVVLMVGLPNSGKTTWLKENAEPGTLYFDSSMTQIRRRRWFIQASRYYLGAPDCVWLDTPCPVLIERNGLRSHERHVPTRKLLAMYEGFEEPTLDEGFKAIVRVPYRAPEPGPSRPHAA